MGSPYRSAKMRKERQLEYDVQSALFYITLFLSCPITLLWDWVSPEASGLGVVGGRGGGAPVPLAPELRPVCGVAGAELAFEGMGEGWGLREG